MWPTFWAYDENLACVQAELDGAPFENGSQVDAEGQHFLHVVAEDLVGHQSTLESVFIVDGTPPVLGVSGVDDGAFYDSQVVITCSAEDDNTVDVFALLDQQAYESGTPVTVDGPHEIVVFATGLVPVERVEQVVLRLL